MAVVLVDGCVAAAALALLLHGRTGEEEEGAACCYSSSLVQPQAERVRHIYCFLQTQQTYEYRAVGCLFCRSSFIVACSLHNNILWVDDERSEAGFEGYSMEEGERGLEGGSQGTIKTGNDWKVNGL